MRLPSRAHTSSPWRIHELTPDFQLEDVWELPGRCAPAEFADLVQMIASKDPGQSSSWPVRALFAIRWRLGALLGWDEEESGIGARVATLRERLPADLRETAPPTFDALPFRSLYLLDDEFAAEVANGTMHGVLHIGLLPDGRAQMAVLVRPNGVLGRAYMLAIRPFRYLIVYPAILREAGREWRERAAARAQPLSGAANG